MLLLTNWYTFKQFLTSQYLPPLSVITQELSFPSLIPIKQFYTWHKDGFQILSPEELISLL